MKSIQFSAKVQICLLKDSIPGWNGYKTGVSPNHVIPGCDYVFEGWLNFIDHDIWLRPGECCYANGWFSIADYDLDKFIPGFVWEITEAFKVVGYVEFIEMQEN